METTPGISLPQKIKSALVGIRAFSGKDGGQDEAGGGRNKPVTGIILGTGLGPLAEALEVRTEIPYADIPHFPAATAEGHAGKLLLGRLSGREVAVFSGRLHFYEGHSLEEVAFPVRILKALGGRNLIVTNIAGGLNPQFQLGDIMVLTDHLNLLPGNPLIGRNFEELGPRFPDMVEPYSRAFIAAALRRGLEQGLALQKGVYACMTGPSLETAAEYRMLRILGADAIGMSTVPEVIVAVHAGLRVLGLSVITDLCLPDALKPIDIPQILSLAGAAEPRLARLIAALVEDFERK